VFVEFKVQSSGSRSRSYFPLLVNKKDFSIEPTRCTIYLYRQPGKRNTFIAGRFTNTEDSAAVGPSNVNFLG
jgi:hypothetical protein